MEDYVLGAIAGATVSLLLWKAYSKAIDYQLGQGLAEIEPMIRTELREAIPGALTEAGLTPDVLSAAGDIVSVGQTLRIF